MQERRWTYYIYYTNDGEVYAYTDDKNLGSAFYTFRRHDFVSKKVLKLSSSDLYELHEDYPESTLRWETLSGVEIPLTMMESITIQTFIVQRQVVDIPLSANINPNIFTTEMKGALWSIGYIAAYMSYINGDKMITSVDPLLTFVKLYGHTVYWKGGEVYETLSVLSNRPRRNIEDKR